MRRRRTAAGAALLAAIALAAAAAPAAAQEGPAPIGLRDVIATTLTHSATVSLAEADFRAAEGAHLQSLGTFDPRSWATVANERSHTPDLASAGSPSPDVLSSEITYGTGIDWRLRSGIVLSPSVAYSRHDVSTREGLPRNVGVAEVNVMLPALRGRGGGLHAANERAADAAMEAGGADLRHLRAVAVRDAVAAYWGYVAAVRNLEVYREAEAHAVRLVGQTETLIEADERPAADRLSVAASLASRRASRFGAEQAVTAARQTLAEAMGIPAYRLSTLPIPADAFPGVPPGSHTPPLRSDSAAVSLALRHRADLAAARERRMAAHHLQRGTRDDARSQLDLNLGIGYTGLESGADLERLIAPFYSSQRGLQGRVSVTYGRPVGNRAAAGGALRSAAAERRAEIVVDELARIVALEVLTAGETLRRTLDELRLSEEAVRLHSAAVASENQKFRLGTSTVFEVIQAEDALTAATLGAINVQRRYAVALAQLRFRSGGLQGGAPDDADLAELTGWPQPARADPGGS